jgi:hypothetical protein
MLTPWSTKHNMSGPIAWKSGACCRVTNTVVVQIGSTPRQQLWFLYSNLFVNHASWILSLSFLPYFYTILYASIKIHNILKLLVNFVLVGSSVLLSFEQVGIVYPLHLHQEHGNFYTRYCIIEWLTAQFKNVPSTGTLVHIGESHMKSRYNCKLPHSHEPVHSTIKTLYIYLNCSSSIP